MEFELKRFGDVVVMQPSGRIDQASHADFGNALQEAIANAKAEACGVVVDLGAIEYVSSIGLRAIMKGAQEAKKGKVPLGAGNLSSVVKEIFEISKFHFVVPVSDTTRDAIAAISEDAARQFDQT